MPAARSPGRAYSPTAARNPGQMRRFAVRCSLPLRSDLHLAPRQALPPLPPTTPIKGNSRAAYPCESPFMFVLNRLTCSLLSRPRESARTGAGPASIPDGHPLNHHRRPRRGLRNRADAASQLDHRNGVDDGHAVNHASEYGIAAQIAGIVGRPVELQVVVEIDEELRIRRVGKTGP